MSSSLTLLLQHHQVADDNSLFPLFFRLSNESEMKSLELLVMSTPNIVIYDRILDQCLDLYKLENPSVKVEVADLQGWIASRMGTEDLIKVGVWVYYPWSNRLIHLLDEEDFVLVRTIRNRYKISKEEQSTLRSKRVGVIGLSVGQSVSLSIVQERISGEIRIADFDHLELSNLNRIRSGVQNLGLKKSRIVGREILELDPFIKVNFYESGISDSNIEDFLLGNGKLDIVVDECDDLHIKILIRKKCRELGIPVIMDTSDQLMLDVERFDLDKDLSLFHGLVKDESLLENLTIENRKILLAQILEIEGLSEKAKFSLSEIGKSITTWPQLATDVFMGGAFTAKIIRHIFLGDDIGSGRFKMDLVETFKKNEANAKNV